MKDRISVVVPAYNNGQWLPRSLESLVNQTYQDLEIVVVNDGSTDDTARVLNALAEECSRIRVIHQENGGVTAARLRGVAEASGRWIGFLDADDEAEPWMYEKLLENALASGADISHCGHQVVFLDGRVSYVHNSGVRLERDRLAALADLVDGRQVDPSLCTKLFRRELFRGLEEKMDPGIKNNEDYLMNFYLFSGAEKSVYEDVCPYRYLLRSGSASCRKPDAHKVLDPIRVRRTVLEAAPEALQTACRDALIRNCLFAYAQLAVCPEREYDGLRMRVRESLRGQKAHFGVLSRRNRLLAEMICIAPWSFDGAYRLYVRLFQREEQH